MLIIIVFIQFIYVFHTGGRLRLLCEGDILRVVRLLELNPEVLIVLFFHSPLLVVTIPVFCLFVLLHLSRFSGQKEPSLIEILSPKCQGW